MAKTIHMFLGILVSLLTIFCHSAWASDDLDLVDLPGFKQTPNRNANFTPPAPTIKADAYILLDATTGKVIAEKNAKTQMEPASLTKMMTLYIISSALKNDQIRLSDEVRISKNAWSSGGSKMFIKEGQKVKVSDLLQGIIVQSGNDASVAMAEYIAGSEEGFVELMNQEAVHLGMNDTHFTDCTGMPDDEHFSTPYDLAILSRALTTHFPEYYPWYKQQWYTFNGIKQANRNRLLWRYKYADGIKTGHTTSAGYCLAASANKDDMRLIAVIMGAPTEDSRADGSQRLFNYGFRFYKTYKLYSAGDPITESRVWKGQQKHISASIIEDIFVTIPQGQYNQLKVSSTIQQPVIAPIHKGQKLGVLKIRLNNETLAQEDLFAQSPVEKGGPWGRFSDSISLSIHSAVSKDDEQYA